jgi:hypothetical protein
MRLLSRSLGDTGGVQPPVCHRPCCETPPSVAPFRWAAGLQCDRPPCRPCVAPVSRTAAMPLRRAAGAVLAVSFLVPNFIEGPSPRAQPAANSHPFTRSGLHQAYGDNVFENKIRPCDVDASRQTNSRQCWWSAVRLVGRVMVITRKAPYVPSEGSQRGALFRLKSLLRAENMDAICRGAKGRVEGNIRLLREVFQQFPGTGKALA